MEAFVEIIKGFNHLKNISSIKGKMPNKNGPENESLSHLASIVAHAYEMIKSGNGRPSDQNLHDSVKGLVKNI